MSIILWMTSVLELVPPKSITKQTNSKELQGEDEAGIGQLKLPGVRMALVTIVS